MQRFFEIHFYERQGNDKNVFFAARKWTFTLLNLCISGCDMSFEVQKPCSSAAVDLTVQTFTLKVEYPPCRAFKRQGCMPLFCRRAGFVIIAALLSIQETRNPQGRQQQLCFPSVWGRDLGSSVVCQPAGNLMFVVQVVKRAF